MKPSIKNFRKTLGYMLNKFNPFTDIPFKLMMDFEPEYFLKRATEEINSVHLLPNMQSKCDSILLAIRLLMVYLYIRKHDRGAIQSED